MLRRAVVCWERGPVQRGTGNRGRRTLFSALMSNTGRAGFTPDGSLRGEYKLTCRRDEEETIWNGSELGHKISVDRGSLDEINMSSSLDYLFHPEMALGIMPY